AWVAARLRRRAIPPRDIYLSVALFLLSLAFVIWVLVDTSHPVRIALERVMTNLGTLQLGAEGFLRGRGMIWQRYVTFWLDAPLSVTLLGVGYEPWNAHNDFFRLVIVHGVLGTLAILGALCVLCITFSRSLPKVAQRELRLLIALFVLA